MGATLTVRDKSGRPVPVPVSKASGDATETRVWRHEASIEVPVRDAVRRGARASLRSWVVGTDGVRYYAPMITGGVTAISGSPAGGWTVRVRSDEWRVYRADFVRPRTVEGLAAEVIQGLIREAIPGARLSVHPRVRAVRLASTTYEPGANSRWKACEASALAAGAVLYCSAGGTWRLDPPVGVDGPTDWDVLPGEALLSEQTGEDDDDFYNVVAVSGDTEGEDGTKPYAVAVADSRHAAYIGDSAMGWVTGSPGGTGSQGRGAYVSHLTLPVSTSEDAMFAARARITGASMDPRTLVFTSLDNQWLTVGSRLRVVESSGRPSRHVISRRQWSYPPAPMTCETRR